MLSFNFFDSNDWEVVSNEAMKDMIKELDKTIKKMREELFKSNDVIDAMKNKIATLEADNDALRNLNKNMKSLIKNNGIISLSSELNTKIDNQSKEITHLLKAQEKLKAEIVDKEQIISSLDAKCNTLSKKVRKLSEGIRNSDDLSWKAKYDSLKKCVNIQYGVGNRTIDGYISELENKVEKLEEENNKAAETFDKIIDLIREQE